MVVLLIDLGLLSSALIPLLWFSGSGLFEYLFQGFGRMAPAAARRKLCTCSLDGVGHFGRVS
jgi:hypothetical protein